MKKIILVGSIILSSFIFVVTKSDDHCIKHFRKCHACHCFELKNESCLR